MVPPAHEHVIVKFFWQRILMRDKSVFSLPEKASETREQMGFLKDGISEKSHEGPARRQGFLSRTREGVGKHHNLHRKTSPGPNRISLLNTDLESVFPRPRPPKFLHLLRPRPIFRRDPRSILIIPTSISPRKAGIPPGRPRKSIRRVLSIPDNPEEVRKKAGRGSLRPKSSHRQAPGGN